MNTQLRQWSGQKRRAGVSSFGIGGTNAHIVLKEPPTRLALPIPHSQSVELAVLTARTPGALARARQRLADHIRQHPARLADIAWTLQVGRREYKHREAVVCRNIVEAEEALEGKRPSAVISGQAPESPRGVSYLIPGVGDHYLGMAKGLFEMGGRFREELEHCSQLFEAETGERILAELYAFHSRLMQPVAEPLTALFRTADLRPPRIPYVSNLTGNWIKDSEATDPSYWAMHTCQRIRFRDGIDLFKDEAYAAFLEVGPGQALGAWVLQNASDATESQLVVLPSLPHTYDHTPDMAADSNSEE